ncbi:MAG: gliding motility-associated C-terminal domain-containing protein [Bacteroidetes bacterium]|nr:gliding motility-associated C-terminal domain-containing protein [Bacteroidota bacterium]
MKNLLILVIILFTACYSQAQVNGFTITEPSFPAAHNLGTSFPVNISFNWTPSTTGATVKINYNGSLVNYDPGCSSALPSCMIVTNSGSQLTIAMSNLSACTNTGAISFNVCFRFNCPDSCTGVLKQASFAGVLTDNKGTTLNANCTANGILNNQVSLTHSFFSFNLMTAEVTFRVWFNNPDCFYIRDPHFDIALSPSLGLITSVYGGNYTYTIAGNVITPNVPAFTSNANDAFFYVVKLDSCNTGRGQTLISNITLKGKNCNVANSIIFGPVPASFVIPAVPVATSSISVPNMLSTASSFTYTINNTGNTAVTLTATNFLPLVHLKSSTDPTPSGSVFQNTSQALLNGSVQYYDCSSTPTAIFNLTGNNAGNSNAPATNTIKFDHKVTNLLPGQSVSLTLSYDLSSSCNGAAGNPPYKDSLSIAFECAPGGGPAGGCVPCGNGGTLTRVITYNPQPHLGCMQNQFIPGCKNLGDTISLCYEFKNDGDAALTGSVFNIQFPAWLQAITSSIVFTGFSTDPAIIASTNLKFNLPGIPSGAGTYKICLKALVQSGAVGGSNGFWSNVSGGNTGNPQNVCYTSFTICAFAAIGVEKKVKGSLNSSFGNSGSGKPNTTVFYEITVRNTGTVAVDSLVVIDRIPATGNLTILGSPASTLLNCQFNMQMLAAPVNIYTASYTATHNICTGWPATGTPCTAGAWGGAVFAGGVKFDFNIPYTLAPGASYTFTFQTKIPTGTADGLTDCNTAGFIARSKTPGYTINPVETNPVCITVVNDTCNHLCNSDFEDVQLVPPGSQIIITQDSVPCWKTTATDHMIEVWGDGFQSVPSYSGNQFIELNANMVGTLYQTFTATPGSTVAISYAHRGRAGFTNRMSVSIEPAPIGSGTAVVLETDTASITAWTMHTVTYTFPNSGSNFVLSFISLPVGGTSAGGNFLDAISVDCHTDICSKTDSRITRLPTGECCYLLEISNTYRDDYFTGISVTSDNLTLANVSSNNTWSTITYQSPNQVVFTKTPSYNGVPLDSAGFQTLGEICFAGSGVNHIKVDFIGNPPKFDTVCRKTLTNQGCSIPVDTSCVAILDMKSECDTGAVKMKFRVRNNSSFTVRGLTLYSQTPGVSPSPKFIGIPDLLPGQTSALIETALIISNNATHACFFFAACDQYTKPGPSGPFPSWCCMDSIPYCVDIPHCDPCDGISFTATKNDPVKCCYNLTLTSNYHNANIEYLEFTGTGGTQFAIFTGWNIIPPVGSSHIKIKAPAGGIPPGTYTNFASFCLTGTSSAPHMVVIKSTDTKGNPLCTDTLKFDSCQMVTPSCTNIVNDSLYCSGNKVKYTFSVKNNSPFTVYQVDYRTTDPSVVLDSNYTQPHPPIPPGATGGPFTVSIDSTSPGLDRFCMYLTAHNGIYDTATGQGATECCTDSLGGICLPMIKCGGSDTSCCSFDHMKIPTGITPNEDGKNDAFEILNSACCSFISIKVFNRWGNVVYQNGDYKNDWKGVNNSGQKLVQGTYFVLLELPNGDKKSMYVDVRY